MTSEMRTEQIMTEEMIKIAWDAPLTSAYEIMKAAEIRHLPVMDPTGVLIGIISDRDLQRAMIPDRDGAMLSDREVAFQPRARVKDFMSYPVLTVENTFSVRDTAELMVENKVSAFIVTTADKVPVGIVTTEDLLRYLVSLVDKDPARVKMPLSSLIDERKLSEDYFE